MTVERAQRWIAVGAVVCIILIVVAAWAGK